MSQLQHTTKPATFIPAQERRALLLAMGVTIAFMVALIVVVAIANRAPATVSAPALGPADDYFFRHRAVAPALGTMDDYWFRQQAAPITLTDQDDYWFRQRAVASDLGPLDDYGLRHRGE